ncbi:2-oxo acid dehydrogenase subunit E2 [Enterobacteriaceae endosymbiont of Plateumaris consimilis]|uniref:2-oxo acid dehydrogenase subunit E2 n=1 Tax=Enterobacteriaceae endosymbiont of Plateumaris consimilis TaxID=2675794 RepID=UPI001FFCC23B|nr:2-oxo acid dehydrogenase subunit E2 [Enterobacteriaceae endosymbiont of Plateumaris consimilis]
MKIKLPDIGIEEMKVTDILVKKGDKIHKEDSIIVIEGEKTSMEIPSTENGIITNIKVSIGDIVHTGSIILELNNNISTINNYTNIISDDVKDKISDIYLINKIIVPNIDYDGSMKIIKIFVKKGDKVYKNNPLVTLENNKNNFNIISLYDGFIKKIIIKIGDDVKSGDNIMLISTIASENIKKDNINVNSLLNINNIITNNSIHASPSVRKIARKLNINLLNVIGSGNKKRILKEDLLKYISINNNQKNISNISLSFTSDFFQKFGKIEQKEMNQIQKMSAKNLTKNWKNIPHVTQHIEADITVLESFRIQKNNELNKKNKNIKITLLSFLIKICANALKKYPIFNSSLLDNKKIILKKYYNIGIAINTDKGLLVPVIFDLMNKNIIDISRELVLLSNKAKSGKLIPSDMQGGCFTLSNLGNKTGSFFTPIINSPEIAILGISQANIKPFWNGKKFIPHLLLPLSLSYDHRVINGVEAIIFLNYICDLISDIRNLLM